MANPVNLRAIIGVIDKATAPMRGISRGFASMGMQAKLAMANVNRMARQAGLTAFLAQLGKVRTAGVAVARQLGEIAMKAAEIAGIGVLGGIAGLSEMLRSFSERGDNAAKVAARLGMSVGEYQAYAHVAKEADIEQEAFNKGLRKLSLGIASAASGKNAELASLFRHMGISTRDANGHLKTTADILPQVADAFKRNENPTLRLAMAQALFGEKNTEMIDLLAQGGEALRKGREEALKYGTKMTDQQVAAAQALDDAYKHVGMSITGLSNAIGGTLGPVIAPLLEDLAEWIAANREIAASKLKEAVTGVVTALKAFPWESFGSTLRTIGRNISWVVDNTIGWKGVAIAVVALLNAELIMAFTRLAVAMTGVSRALIVMGGRLAMLAFGAVAGAVMNFVTALRAGYGAMAALNLVMSANPIGLVIIGIAALIAIGVLLWKNWDKVKAAWTGLQNWITGGISDLLASAHPLLDVLTFIAKWSPAGIAVRAGAALAKAVSQPATPQVADASSKLRMPGQVNPSPRLVSSRDMLAANSNANASTKVQTPQRVDVGVTLDAKNMPEGVAAKVETTGGSVKRVNTGRAMSGLGRAAG